ncbi:MAG: TRAP transporter substrate-binding protein DctP [Rhizobiaceae bacterium]|nr:TRAP transporter substrate-binding protein DctP [Rhizobiaceae bacterium]
MMNLRSMISRLGTGIAAAAFGFSMFASHTASAETKMVFATHVSAGSVNSRQYDVFLAELAERTGGAIKITDKYNSEALIRAVDMLRSVGRGVADLGYFCAGYSPALLPLTSTLELPYLTTKGDAWAQAATELFENNEDFQNEFRALNVELLAFDAPSPTIIGGNREIKSAADIKGMKLRALGDMGNIVQRGGGATPVPLSAAEIFTSMQTGVIDGYISIPLWMPYPENWLPVTKTIVDPGIGTYYACGLVMNSDVYKGLSDDVKKVLAEMRREFPKKSIQMVMDGEQLTVDAATKQGISFYRFKPEEIDEWKKNFDFDALETDWYKRRQELTKVDLPAFMTKFREILAKYEPNSIYEQKFPETK